MNRAALADEVSWVPAVGEIYSLVAGLFILVQGVRAGVSPLVLAAATFILGVRTFSDVFPVVGPLFADVFTAHKWAARMVVRAIDQQLTAGDGQARGARWWERSAIAA